MTQFKKSICKKCGKAFIKKDDRDYLDLCEDCALDEEKKQWDYSQFLNENGGR